MWNEWWTTKPREWLSFLKENFNPAKFQFLRETINHCLSFSVKNCTKPISKRFINNQAKRIIHPFFNILDTNECNITSTCHKNATCKNTLGSYICTCDPGFVGDGFTCNGM